DRSVDDRDGAQGVDGRLDDERYVGELPAGVLEVGLPRLADLGQPRKIHLEHRVHVRGRAPAEYHVLRDALAHHRHSLDLIGGAWLELWRSGHRSARRRTGCLPRRSRARHRCGGGGLAEIAEDVVLGDAAGDTRPTDPRDVDVVFLRNLSYER